jgi:sugar-specific transcriptional regulator TrmB
MMSTKHRIDLKFVMADRNHDLDSAQRVIDRVIAELEAELSEAKRTLEVYEHETETELAQEMERARRLVWAVQELISQHMRTAGDESMVFGSLVKNVRDALKRFGEVSDE